MKSFTFILASTLVVTSLVGAEEVLAVKRARQHSEEDQGFKPSQKRKKTAEGSFVVEAEEEVHKAEPDWDHVIELTKKATHSPVYLPEEKVRMFALRFRANRIQAERHFSRGEYFKAYDYLLGLVHGMGVKRVNPHFLELHRAEQNRTALQLFFCHRFTLPPVSMKMDWKQQNTLLRYWGHLSFPVERYQNSEWGDTKLGSSKFSLRFSDIKTDEFSEEERAMYHLVELSDTVDGRKRLGNKRLAEIKIIQAKALAATQPFPALHSRCLMILLAYNRLCHQKGLPDLLNSQLQGYLDDDRVDPYIKILLRMNLIGVGQDVAAHVQHLLNDETLRGSAVTSLYSLCEAQNLEEPIFQVNLYKAKRYGLSGSLKKKAQFIETCLAKDYVEEALALRKTIDQGRNVGADEDLAELDLQFLQHSGIPYDPTITGNVLEDMLLGLLTSHKYRADVEETLQRVCNLDQKGKHLPRVVLNHVPRVAFIRLLKKYLSEQDVNPLSPLDPDLLVVEVYLPKVAILLKLLTTVDRQKFEALLGDLDPQDCWIRLCAYYWRKDTQRFNQEYARWRKVIQKDEYHLSLWEINHHMVITRMNKEIRKIGEAAKLRAQPERALREGSESVGLTIPMVKEECGKGGKDFRDSLTAFLSEQVERYTAWYTRKMVHDLGAGQEASADRWKYNAERISSGACRAMQEHESNYLSILAEISLLRGEGMLSRAEADEAAAVIRGFQVLHQNNPEICQELIEARGVRNYSQVFHVQKERDIVLHPEQSDVDLDQRASVFHNILMAAWTAVDQSLDPTAKVKFFKQAFTTNAPCFEARSRKIDSWRIQNQALLDCRPSEAKIKEKTKMENVLALAEDLLGRMKAMTVNGPKYDRAKAAVEANKEAEAEVRWALGAAMERYEDELEVELAGGKIYKTLAEQVIDTLAGQEASDGTIGHAEIIDCLKTILGWPDIEEPQAIQE